MTKPLTIRCNCLVETRHVRRDRLDALGTAVGAPALGRAVQGSVARFGNWVGGRAVVTSEGVAFQTNALNRAVQSGDTDLFVPFDAVRDVRLGRMFRLFATVDVETASGTVRFRAMGRSNARLRDAIAGRTGG